MAVRYWVAKYTSDLFRDEPRNVGVIVHLEDKIRACFLGESEDRQIDGRKLRGLPYPDVYRQWIEYWRSKIDENDLESIIESGKSQYCITEGGEVDDVGTDAIEDVTAYLYTTLISEGGFSQALAREEESVEEVSLSLEDDISSEFLRMNLLENVPLLVPHPIERSIPIKGARLEYRPTFIQRNERLYIMEPVDFTIPQKRRSRDHAGWSAYMFYDIRKSCSEADPIAIVKYTDVDQENDDVVTGLNVLSNESRVINWLSDDQRANFLEERKAISAA